MEKIEVDTLADALPREQKRCRKLLDQYKTLRNTEGVNVEFVVAMIELALANAERAASAGDVVAMLRAYFELKSFNEELE